MITMLVTQQFKITFLGQDKNVMLGAHLFDFVSALCCSSALLLIRREGAAVLVDDVVVRGYAP